MTEEVCGTAGGDLVPGVFAEAALTLDEFRGGGVFGFVEELRDGAVSRYLFVTGGFGEGRDLCVKLVVAGGGDVGFCLGGDTGAAKEAGEAEAPRFEGDFGEGCAGADVVTIVLSHDGADG